MKIANFGWQFVVAALAFASVAPTTAQTEKAARPAAKSVAKRSVTAIPRMRDGHPDLRGTWQKVGGGLNEANPPRTRYQADCGEAFGGAAEPFGFTGGPDGRGVKGPRRDQKPNHAPATPVPQGIIDPANRVLPLRSEAASARKEFAEKMGPPAESINYIELSILCTPIAPWYDPTRGPVQFVHTPGQIVMFNEWDHTTRVIYMDGRSHVSSNMRFFGGDSIGHWEGDTLVVDTTNLNGMGAWTRTWSRYSLAMHLTERFTRVSPDLMNYEIVYDDPGIFTRPVKSVGYFYPSDDDEEVMEITCHEGSTTLKNMFGF